MRVNAPKAIVKSDAKDSARLFSAQIGLEITQGQSGKSQSLQSSHLDAKIARGNGPIAEVDALLSGVSDLAVSQNRYRHAILPQHWRTVCDVYRPIERAV